MNSESTNSTLPALCSQLKIGRPRALDESRQEQVCALVSLGCSLEWVARFVGCAASTIRREARRNRQFGRKLQRAGMRADLEPLQAVHRASDKHWRAAAWLVNQRNAHRAATQETRNLKLWKLNEFAKNVRWMLMGAIRDADVLANVLGLLDQEIAKANGKPPTPKHVAQRKCMERAEDQILSLTSSGRATCANTTDDL